MIWDRVRGHDEVVTMFRRALARGRMGHAWLFVGPDGIGKRLFARGLAQCLFCERCPDEELDACGECDNCRRMRAGTHPDYLTVSRIEGKSELLIEQFVGAKEQRGKAGLCHDLALSPMAGGRRFAVVDEVNLMGPASANAFLKTLEEPPRHSTLVLISDNLDGLLPTIRSRCQLVRFKALPDEDVAALLLEEELVPEDAQARLVAALAEGSLATARQLVEPGLRALRTTLYDGLAAHPLDVSRLAKTIVDGIDELGGDNPTQRRHAGWVVRFAVEFYRHALRALAGRPTAEVPQVQRFVEALPEGLGTVDVVSELIDRCADAERQLEQKSPIPLVFEALLDDLALRLRPLRV